jgi:hypothetical protein
MMKGLIMDYLQLPTRPYCASSTCPERNLSVIVDKNGLNSGMTTFVDSMSAKATTTGAVRIFLESEVIKVSSNGISSNGTFTLSFANGSSIQAANLVLNLPQQPLLQLLRASPMASLPLVSPKTNAVPAVPLPLQALKWVKGAPSMKLYLVYEDAWWHNELNLTYGYFNNSAGPSCQTSGTAIPQFAPLSGRYHDGMLICDGAKNKCRGALEAAYAFDDVSIGFYRPYLADSSTPAMIYNWPKESGTSRHGKESATNDASTQTLPVATDLESVELLTAVHSELVHLHANLLQKAGVYDKVAAMRPTSAVLSIWDRCDPYHSHHRLHLLHSGSCSMKHAALKSPAYSLSRSTHPLTPHTPTPLPTLVASGWSQDSAQVSTIGCAMGGEEQHAQASLIAKRTCLHWYCSPWVNQSRCLL